MIASRVERLVQSTRAVAQCSVVAIVVVATVEGDRDADTNSRGVGTVIVAVSLKIKPASCGVIIL